MTTEPTTTLPASTGGARKGGPGRWAIAAGAIVVILAYPVWRLTTNGPPPPTEGTTALNASFRAFSTGRYPEAIAAAKAAMVADPNLAADAYNNIAVAYWKLGQLENGIQAAQQAIRIKPDYQLAKNNLSAMQRELDASGGPSAPGLAQTPAAALLNQSLQDAQAHRFKECVDAATRSVKLDPTSARAFNNIAFCDGNLQLWDEAIRNAQEAIRLDPSLQLAKNNLAWAQQARAKTGRTPD